MVDGNVISTNRSYTFIVDKSITILGCFSINTYTVTVTNGTGGGTYKHGDKCTVTATVPSTHNFTSWSNGVTSNPYTFTVTSNVTLTANLAVKQGAPGTSITISDWSPTEMGGSNHYNWKNIGIGAKPVKFTLLSYTHGRISLASKWVINLSAGENQSVQMYYINPSGNERWSKMNWHHNNSTGEFYWGMISEGSGGFSYTFRLEY